MTNKELNQIGDELIGFIDQILKQQPDNFKSEECTTILRATCMSISEYFSDETSKQSMPNLIKKIPSDLIDDSFFGIIGIVELIDNSLIQYFFSSPTELAKKINDALKEAMPSLIKRKISL